MSDYPYDDEVLELVAQRLYAAVPAMYRVPDEPPDGAGELLHLLEVLAAPLAVLHQSIQELQADLFIDTADDRMVPYLAEMVGTRLAFPDAASNRRDVRGTVGWRRRKGTPTALEEMGSELTGQPVVLQEGWKRIQLAQDLDLVRPERVVPDLRPAIVAEQADGPLDAMFHAVDVRRISATTGRRHPKHVAHWLMPTTTFPLAGATAHDRSLPLSDRRFTFDPLGVRRPLRARRAAGDREPFVDRILEQHFAAAPERWFGVDGGLTIRFCGLPAGIAGDAAAERVASTGAASPKLVAGRVTLTALELPSRGWRGAVRVELMAGSAVRASIDLDAAGVVGSASGGPAPAGAPGVRLTPLGGAAARFFPGATLEIASDDPEAALSAEDAGLARDGFLRGVLHVTIPALEIRTERVLNIAPDGSLYDAGALLSPGPGPAWPALSPISEPRMLSRVPAAPGRAPVVMHGGRALGATGTCALVFEAQEDRAGGADFVPFQRLEWTGEDPAGATAVTVGTPAEVADRREADPDSIALAVRFECAQAGVRLCPAEVAWSADDGRTVLIHLPQMAPEEVVRVGEDGSTWASDSTASRRVSLGQVAPIREAAGLRRRRVRWRRLCAWDNEVWPSETLVLTARGRLDVDVLHGLFACAREEPPQGSVTVDYEEGATAHVGARPAAREPVLDLRLPPPTRLVAGAGALHPDSPAALLRLPLHRTLTEALAAVTEADEVIQFEDSATYTGEAPLWPNCDTLVIQAAERERPTILISSWTGAPSYTSLTLRGLAFGGVGIDLPANASLELCTVLDPAGTLTFADGAQAFVTRCETGALALAGTGALTIADSIVEARPDDALSAPGGEVVLDRCSVGGDAFVRVIDASETIFDGQVTVENRFRGCVRYSRVTSDSTLPRVHRNAVDVPVRIVSSNRRDPAWWRLRADSDPAIARGAENGSEIGAFGLAQFAQRVSGFERRLSEFTPAGLVTGIIRID